MRPPHASCMRSIHAGDIIKLLLSVCMYMCVRLWLLPFWYAGREKFGRVSPCKLSACNAPGPQCVYVSLIAYGLFPAVLLVIAAIRHLQFSKLYYLFCTSPKAAKFNYFLNQHSSSDCSLFFWNSTIWYESLKQAFTLTLFCALLLFCFYYVALLYFNHIIVKQFINWLR